MSERTRGQRKSMIGTVVSVKMDKTAVVSVERRYPHQLYHKIVRSTKRYKAHDPGNAAVLGDTVRIVETRPISKEKRWRIAETLVRGNVADIAPREIGAPEESLYRPERPEPAPAPAAAVATAVEPEAEPSVEPEASAEVTSSVEAEKTPVAEAPAVEAEETPVAKAAEAPAVEAEEAPVDDAPVAEAAEGPAVEAEEAPAEETPAEEAAEGDDKE